MFSVVAPSSSPSVCACAVQLSSSTQLHFSTACQSRIGPYHSVRHAKRLFGGSQCFVRSRQQPASVPHWPSSTTHHRWPCQTINRLSNRVCNDPRRTDRFVVCRLLHDRTAMWPLVHVPHLHARHIELACRRSCRCALSAETLTNWQ